MFEFNGVLLGARKSAGCSCDGLRAKTGEVGRRGGCGCFCGLSGMGDRAAGANTGWLYVGGNVAGDGARVVNWLLS